MSTKKISIAISIPLFVAFILFVGVLIVQNMQNNAKATMPRALQQEVVSTVPTIVSQKNEQKEIDNLTKELDETADDGAAEELESLTKEIDSL